MTKFTFPDITHKFPLTAAEKLLFRFKKLVAPSKWVETGFYLSHGYSVPGFFSFDGREWQREIIDAPLIYNDITISASTQIGKSVILEALWTWFQLFIGGRSLLAYQDAATARDVFSERLKMSIKQNLAALWAGREDDLKQDKMILKNGIARCGSCNVEATFSTFGQDWVFCDEIAKWKSSFDALAMAKGRFEDYMDLVGYHGRLIKSSSPKYKNDLSYKEAYGADVLRLIYKRQCPRCGFYHLLVDRNIHELPNSNGDFDHNPLRILNDNAAVYKCPNCTGIIADDDRYKMDKSGVWATEEESVNDVGVVVNPDKLRGVTQKVAFLYINRLISTPEKYPFARALSSFFDAQTKADPKAMEIYQNEHAARWIDRKSAKMSYGYLRDKAKNTGYKQYHASTVITIPEKTAAIVFGGDTQDGGFYYVFRGWGVGLETWLLYHDYLPCDTKETRYKNPVEVAKLFKSIVGDLQFVRAESGTVVPVMFGLLDEGGHRKADVVQIVRSLPWLHAYKGESRKSGELIYHSKNQELYLGNTEMLSRLFGNYLESDNFHFPEDVGVEYLRQVKNQYDEDRINRFGTKVKARICADPDHYRDCENYALGATYILNLATHLTDAAGTERIKLTNKNLMATDDDAPKVQPKSNDPFSKRQPISNKYR